MGKFLKFLGEQLKIKMKKKIVKYKNVTGNSKNLYLKFNKTTQIPKQILHNLKLINKLTYSRLKLYLEQFAIPSCVLNSELPASIRCHSVNQFNQGIYDIIIASDENILEDPQNADSKKRFVFPPKQSNRFKFFFVKQKKQRSRIGRGTRN